MRSLFAALTGLSLVLATLGCHHTAGVCDCEGHGDYHGHDLAPVAAPAAAPAAAAVGRMEPIREMPKAMEPSKEKAALSLDTLAPAP